MKSEVLEKLPQLIKENNMKQFGTNIVKYQNFKTSVIINKIDNAGLAITTLRSYITSGINYIKTGKKYKQYGDFYKYIDEAISNHVQPLVPKEEEKRVVIKIKKSLQKTNNNKNNNNNNVKTAVQIENNENKFLAVQINDSFIITMDTEKDINTLISLLKYFSDITCKTVDIKIDSRRKENEIHS